MILVDFTIRTEAGFGDRGAIDRRMLHIAEAVRMELARRPRIDAPFRKMVVKLYNADAQVPQRPVTNIEAVAQVRVGVIETRMFAPYLSFRSYLLGTVRQAIDQVSSALGWSPDALHLILDDLGEREPVFHYHLHALSKVSRTLDRRVDVFYDMTEQETILRAMISDTSGQLLREEIIAAYAQPMPLEYFFPVQSAIIKHGRMIFRADNKDLLAELVLVEDNHRSKR